MENFNEIKVAIIVAIIMITICLIAFVSVKSKNNIKDVDVSVYKLYEIEGDDGKTKYEYHGCGSIATDEKLVIYREVNKAYGLDDNDIVTGIQIKGEYKVTSGNKTINFDVNDNSLAIIYRDDTRKLYEFNSNIYQIVKDLCE